MIGFKNFATMGTDSFGNGTLLQALATGSLECTFFTMMRQFHCLHYFPTVSVSFLFQIIIENQ